MLGWLLRYGWVTQLRTFSWVVAWPEIKYEVEYELEGARLRKAVADAEQGSIDNAIATSSTPAVGTISGTYPHSQAPAKAEATKFLSNTPATAITSAPPQQTITEQTAERARLNRHREKAIKDLQEFNKKPKPEATAHPSLNRAPHLKGIQPQLILDPVRAEQVDSLYLVAISRRLDGPPSSETQAAETTMTTAATGGSVSSGAVVGSISQTGMMTSAKTASATTTAHSNRIRNGKEVEGKEEKKSFLRWAKYFNGRTSMERIALLEGVKRKEVWSKINSWDEFLNVVRTW